jgi:hypothetical protein
MNVSHTAVFTICASLTMLLVAAESNAQSSSRNPTSFSSSSPIASPPVRPSVNYARPQGFTPPNQPMTNVYRPAAPMPHSNYNGSPSNNGYISQPRSFTPPAGFNSTIALRAPRSNFTPARVYQTQSPPANYFPTPRYTPTRQYVAPANRGFSPTVSRPGCANGNCGR